MGTKPTAPQPTPPAGKSAQNPGTPAGGSTAAKATTPARGPEASQPPAAKPTVVTKLPTAKAQAPAPAAAAPAAKPQAAHFLQKIQLFSLLSWQECDAIVRKLKRRDFPPNHTIVREGAPGDSMFLVTNGKVEVRKKDPNTGIDFLLAELGAGTCFGEMALLTGKPRAASVVAIEPTTVGVLEANDLQQLLMSFPKMGISLTRILAERLEKASEQVGIEFINLAKLQFDARVMALLPQQMILQHKVLPVAFYNNRLTLAMVNPNNLVALDDVRRIIKGVIIEPVVCSEEDFKKFLETTYAQMIKKEEEQRQKQLASAAKSLGTKTAEASAAAGVSPDAVLESLQSEALKDLETVDEDSTAEQKASVTELKDSAQDAPVVRMANAILALAIKRGTSDIHIEPREKELYVRFRIDGLLQVAQILPKKIQMGLISRFKILSKLDIAEKRLPQDGRISVVLEDRRIDFRVSTVPSKWGEKICMRILDKSNTTLGLDKLISRQDTLELVRDMVAQPYGIIYVTGPTGSGKTTTLYSALAEINDPDINISTAEDPIEYDLPGVNQVQVHKDIGLDFARVLRAFLRQDPDVILVGETRDKETAKIAVEAALTGHLVFTTLHTNDAAGAFIRLDEMGIEPFLISSSTIGIVAQRLARRLCQKCKEPYQPDEITRKYMGAPPQGELTFYRQAGCSACNGTGYKGRVGIYEVMRMTGNLRRMVVQKASTDDIREAAQKEGMLTLRDYGLWLLQAGLSSVDEVLECVVVQE